MYLSIALCFIFCMKRLYREEEKKDMEKNKVVFTLGREKKVSCSIEKTEGKSASLFFHFSEHFFTR